MDTVMIIDCLCRVIESQARVIREQAAFIENELAVDEEMKKRFAGMWEDAEAELDRYRLRTYENTSDER